MRGKALLVIWLNNSSSAQFMWMTTCNFVFNMNLNLNFELNYVTGELSSG